MTLPATARYTPPFSGNGSTTAFPFTFKVFAKTDIEVVVVIDDIESTLVLDSDYSVALNSDQVASPGGTVTYPITGTALATGNTLTIAGALPYDQTTDLPSGGSFSATALENALDRTVMQVQQLAGDVGRTLQLSITTPAGVDVTLPSPEADSLLGWDSTGAALRNYTPATGSVADVLVQLASSTSGKGSKLVAFIQRLAGAVARWVEDKLAERLSVKDFGAVGDGVTNDTSAINLAIAAATGRTLFFPYGTYLVRSTINIPDGVRFTGEGGQRAATIKKGFNGDLITMQSLTTLDNLNLDCQGATYTGRGIYIESGFSQNINRVRVTLCYGVALEFAANAGGGSHITSFEADVITADAVGIKFGADYSQAVPRFLDSIWLSNSMVDISNSGNGSSITNFYIRGFVTGPSYDKCTLIHIANGRISNTTPQTITCSDCDFVNIAMGPAVTLDDCQGIRMTNVGFNGLTINGDVRYSSISDQWQTYTPVWTQASGTGPALGNGAITGVYQNTDYGTAFQIRLVMGSTTTYGDGTAGWRISLPRVGAATNQYGFTTHMTRGGAVYVGASSIGSLEQAIALAYGSQSVRSTWPAVWANGDELIVSGYMLNY